MATAAGTPWAVRPLVSVLTGKSFFPDVISAPFHHGLVIVFTAAAIMSFVGALVSLMRGKQFYYEEPGATPAPVTAAVNGHSGTQPSVINGNGNHAAGHTVNEAGRDRAAGPAPGGRG